MNAPSVVLGLDVSTTATKAILIAPDGSVVGVASSEYDFESPRPLWAEQDPGLWWTAAQEAIGRVLRETGTPAEGIAAIGAAGQMHGLVLLDEHEEVVRPAILWNDQRTAAECDLIREIVGRERFIAITGNEPLTGFTAGKLLWVREHEPEAWARARHMLLPKDYVRLKLTGEHALDVADGAGTVLFDLAARTWSSEVVEALGPRPGHAAADGRGAGHRGLRDRGGSGCHGPAGRHAGRRRGRGPGRQRGRRGRRGAGHRRHVRGHLGGRLRAHGRSGHRAGGTAARLLSRGSRARGTSWA